MFDDSLFVPAKEEYCFVFASGDILWPRANF